MIRSYKVADHVFDIVMDDASPLWEKSVQSYGPFEVSEEGERIFRLHVGEFDLPSDKRLVYTNRETVEAGFILLSVYRTE